MEFIIIDPNVIKMKDDKITHKLLEVLRENYHLINTLLPI
jgi:hypothetical protein